jgi:rhamnopyranosyl-N-acetylglucosaminyl-diphospho-decaprenol beta-1,3/1,4-galactofuranosyltransferase
MRDVITAVIVTYNRKDLLLECLGALRLQTRRPDRIVILDNACADGTRDLLAARGILEEPDIDYIRLQVNEGAAGGFYWGIRYAYEQGADWIWVMDDDVEPAPDALAQLEAHTDLPSVGFLSSSVIGRDGVTPMNTPIVDTESAEGRYPSWGIRLGEGLVKVSRATFISTLISRPAVADCGFPNRRFYIWGDDFEYTHRVRRAGFDGWLVGNSRVLHKRTEMRQLALMTEPDPTRMEMFRYLYRNITWTSLHYSGKRAMARTLGLRFKQGLRILARAPDRRLKRLSILIRGTFQALRTPLDNEDGWELSAVAAEVRPALSGDVKDRQYV